MYYFAFLSKFKLFVIIWDFIIKVTFYLIIPFLILYFDSTRASLKLNISFFFRGQKRASESLQTGRICESVRTQQNPEWEDLRGAAESRNDRGWRNRGHNTSQRLTNTHTHTSTPTHILTPDCRFYRVKGRNRPGSVSRGDQERDDIWRVGVSVNCPLLCVLGVCVLDVQSAVMPQTGCISFTSCKIY